MKTSESHCWTRKPLADVAKAEWGNTSITKASYVESGYPAFSAAGSDGFLPTSEWEGPAVVLSAIGARCGKCFYADGKWTAIKNTIVIQADSSTLSHKFLFYYLNDATRWKISGSGQPFITLKTVRETGVPAPSLAEQIEVVAEIEKQFTRLDAGIAALRRTQANLKRYRAALLKAACEGRLVPTEAALANPQSPKRGPIPRGGATPCFESGAMLLERSLVERRKVWAGRGSYKDPVSPKTSNLPAPPEEWTWASIGQLTADSMIGLDRGRAQQSKNAAAGVPYIKMNNVTMDGRVLFDNMMFVPASKEEATNFAVREGDILFNTRNSKELVGKVGLVRSPPAGAIYNNNLMRIRVSTCVSPTFLSLQMCSHGFRQRMELVKKATTNIAAVYGKDLWPLPIALPPLAEQTRIVAEVERRLSVVEELETAVNANLQRASRLRQAILQRAFAGGLAA